MNEREQLKEMEYELSKLSKKISDTKERIRLEDAAAFIKANHITLDDIHLSDAEHNSGMYFNTVWDFAEHIRRAPKQKRFVEWNAQIHFTSDILSGKWSSAPARLKDVEKA